MKKALFLLSLTLLLSAGATPLHEAVFSNCTAEVVGELVAGGASINLRNEDGFTVLMTAALTNSHPEVIEKLVEMGADLTNDEGQEAVRLAALNNNSEVMKTLITLGANVQARYGLGDTLLMEAAKRNSHTDVLDVLVQAGIPVNAVDDFGETAFVAAVHYNGETDAPERLVNFGADVNHLTDAHMTALNYASARNSDLIRRLLEMGADVNAVTRKGYSKLIYAGKFKNESDTFDLLLKYGADVNLRADDGTSALMKAVEFNNAYSVYRLLNKGADPTPVDEDGMSALDYANRYAQRVEATEDTEIQLMLESALQAWTAGQEIAIEEPKVDIEFSKCFLKYNTMNGDTEIILYDVPLYKTVTITEERFKRAFELSEFEIKELMFSEPGSDPNAVRVLGTARNFMRNAPIEQLFSKLLKTPAEVDLQQSFPQLRLNVVLPMQKKMYVGENNALEIFHNEDESKQMIVFDISSEPLEVVFGWRKNLPVPESKPAAKPDPELQQAVQQFQRDADVVRLEHLLYWSALIEEYHQTKNYYPLQDQLKETDFAILVKIATKVQLQFLSPGSTDYRPGLDMNADGRFKELPVSEFVSELETVLEREIPERYDIQKAPTVSPVGYYYFATPDGYLLWCICPTFGVSKISTLLNDGFTPSVNVVSQGMKGQVTKALTREELVENPIFKEWQKRKLSDDKKTYVRELIRDFEKDSKNP